MALTVGLAPDGVGVEGLGSSDPFAYRYLMLHLRLLGTLEATDVHGDDVTPIGAREQAGLVCLALSAPQPLSTERLASEMYDDRPSAAPRNAVQAMVSRLRKGLGRAAGVVETTASGYRLSDVALDIDEADDLLRSAIDATDVEEAAETLQRAKSLWRGPTLDGLGGGLIDAERHRLDELRADAEDAVLALRVAAGDPTVSSALDAAVAEQPLREGRWELLMLALYRDGRQADALRAFQRVRTALGEQLGLEPGPALAALERRILEHDPALVAGRAATGERAISLVPGFAGSDAQELPGGTVTVVLCDVQGSVRRWESAPTTTAHDVSALHAIWAEAAVNGDGWVVKSTGDGVLTAFSTAEAALVCAATAARRHHETGLSVRVAVNSGSLQPVDGDYRGPAVNRCARLLDLAHGEQVLVSGSTAELARGGLDRSLSLRELGPHWLRDVPDAVPVFQLDGDGLRSTFPPLRSSGPHTLPRLRTPLLGRDELVSQVVAAVDDGDVVTLLGPGGIGKTSIAVAAAWALAEGRPVSFVDLARVGDPANVAQRMVDDVTTAGDDQRDPVERLVDRLRHNPDLVVVDNAEHVIDAVVDIVDRVTAAEPKGSFLVTSRLALGLVDETVIAVPPLALPEGDDDLATTGRTPAVRLFLDRVKAARPGTEIPSGLLPVVSHICRRLDGLPLAIELAAGRASVLSVEDVAARLDDQLRLLRQLRSKRERRHRSLEAVVSWSVDQLSPSGRQLFVRLSVMAGRFGLGAAEALLERCGVATDSLLDDLEELVSASLLQVEDGGSRFRMLEPIRQAAEAELNERGLTAPTRRAHVRWVIDIANAASACRGEDRGAAFRALDNDADQIHSSLVWVAETGDAELAGELAYPVSWWLLTRNARLGERLLVGLLTIADRERNPVGWAWTVAALGVVTAAHPRSDVADLSLDAIDILEPHAGSDRALLRVVALFAQTGAASEQVFSLLAEAEALVDRDDVWASAVVDMAAMAVQSLMLLTTDLAVDAAKAVHLGERAAEAFRRLGETWALGVTLGEMGRLLQKMGELDRAELCYVESLELIDDADCHGSHYVLSELGRLSSLRGEHDQAAAFHDRAYAIAELDGTDVCIAQSLGGMANAAAGRGDEAEAVELYRRCLAILDESSHRDHGQAEWVLALATLLEKRPELA